MDPQQVFELSVYRRDGWCCVRCQSTVGLAVYRHGGDVGDERSYSTYCARCAPRRTS